MSGRNSASTPAPKRRQPIERVRAVPINEITAPLAAIQIKRAERWGERRWKRLTRKLLALLSGINGLTTSSPTQGPGGRRCQFHPGGSATPAGGELTRNSLCRRPRQTRACRQLGAEGPSVQKRTVATCTQCRGSGRMRGPHRRSGKESRGAIGQGRAYCTQSDPPR
jgi:hypothetical protein